MSWDIFVQNFPAGVDRVADIPKAFRPTPIGRRTEIISKIQEVVPTADFSNPSWGVIDAKDWCIEVNIGREEICDGFVLQVRGGDAAVGAVAAILSHLVVRALDSQTGEFLIVGPEAIESFRRWRSYRDQVCDSGRAR